MATLHEKGASSLVSRRQTTAYVWLCDNGLLIFWGWRSWCFARLRNVCTVQCAEEPPLYTSRIQIKLLMMIQWRIQDFQGRGGGGGANLWFECQPFIWPNFPQKNWTERGQGHVPPQVRSLCIWMTKKLSTSRELFDLNFFIFRKYCSLLYSHKNHEW